MYGRVVVLVVLVVLVMDESKVSWMVSTKLLNSEAWPQAWHISRSDMDTA